MVAPPNFLLPVRFDHPEAPHAVVRFPRWVGPSDATVRKIVGAFAGCALLTGAAVLTTIALSESSCVEAVCNLFQGGEFLACMQKEILPFLNATMQCFFKN